MYKIYPQVKSISSLDGQFSKKNQYGVFFKTAMVNAFTELKTMCEAVEKAENEADFLFLTDTALQTEEYRLEVTEKIRIYSKTESGAFYAVQSLKQIFAQTSNIIKGVKVMDAPDLEIRGFMLDISRDKVPHIEFVYELIDVMSFLKMNHLELYVEGFSYGYPSFKELWADKTPVTVEEYKAIESYANRKMVDLVPNQNGFGHMAPWLEIEEYKDLAECPDGIHLWGTHRKPGTLNPLDERSIELVKKMYQDMLPYSNSKYFNMNFDEPFELGKGKSKEVCEKEGLGNVYIDYTLKAYEEIKKHGKIPMMWGDVLIHHPDALDRLPDDMLFIDWGYDGNYPFSKNLKLLQDKNIEFLAAPGTTSWVSLAGRTMDMIFNIYNAHVYTKAYQGKGVILTDWGDFGHLQYWPISLPALVFNGLLSWRVSEGAYTELKHVLNRYIFKDNNKLMADILLDFGTYNKYENGYMSNGTQTFYGLIWMENALKEADPLSYFGQRFQQNPMNSLQYKMLQRHFNDILERLEYVDMEKLDGDWIKEEIEQTVRLLTQIQKVIISFDDLQEKTTRIDHLKHVLKDIDFVKKNHATLWLRRNKKGGLDNSLSHIETLRKFAELKLADLVK